MTALRLAEHVEHTTDVSGMLQTMSCDQFDEWCAKDRIEPIGHGQRMLGLIAYMIGCYLGKSDELKPELFIPWINKDADGVDMNAAKTFVSGILGKPQRELI